MSDRNAENGFDILSFLEGLHVPERLARLDAVLEARTASLTVVLDQVQNYHNISAVIRSADAFGLADVHLIGGTFEFSPSISQGTERWLQLNKYETVEEALHALHGYKLVVLQPQSLCTLKDDGPPSIPVTQLPFEENLALVFGNEKNGVSPSLLQNASFAAYIPMYGFVESLNISVACAITLFCSTISPTSPAKRTLPLSAEKKKELKSVWLKNGVKRVDTILREAAKRYQP